jgi:hypothetical protein
MEQPRETLRSSLPVLLAALFPLVLAVVFTYVQPRPYPIFDVDQEPGYFFDALCFSRGIVPPISHDHPGIPASLLGAAVIRLGGFGLESIQPFLNVMYLLAGVLCAAALAGSQFLIGPRLSAGSKVFLLAMLLGFPPIITYTNYFGCEALIWAVAFTAICLLFRVIVQPDPPGSRELFALGILGGLGMALKFTFILALVPLALIPALRILEPAGRAWLPRAVDVLTYWSVLGGSFLLLCLPAINHIPGVLVSDLLLRKDAQVPLEVLVERTVRLLEVFRLSPMLLFACVLVVLSSAFLVAMTRRPERRLGMAKGPVLVAALVCPALFLYFLLTANPTHPDMGSALRNITPSYVAALLPVMLALHIAERRCPTMLARTTRFLLPAAAFGLAVVSLVSFVKFRASMIESSRERQARFAALLPILPQPVLVWESQASFAYGGPASFALWGNYRYGGNHFSEEITRLYPETGLLMVREICQWIHMCRNGEIRLYRFGNPLIDKLYHGTGTLRPGHGYHVALWNTWAQPPRDSAHARKTTATVLVQKTELERELALYAPVPQFEACLKDLAGPCTRSEVKVGGEDFLIYTVQPRPNTLAGPVK